MGVKKEVSGIVSKPALDQRAVHMLIVRDGKPSERCLPVENGDYAFLIPRIHCTVMVVYALHWCALVTVNGKKPLKIN